ncbi:hypothetical protein AHF37_09872 [Paragonimus kellicotti]|nr:hypothetical protein AHF37_09872 [Paragonimus kellicotti]
MDFTGHYKAVIPDKPLLFYPEHHLYTTAIPNGCGAPITVNKNQVNSTEHLPSVAAFAPVNSDPSEQSKEDRCKSRNGYSKSARLKSLFKTDEPIPNDVELNEICEFARYFKLRRLTLGLTQTQVGTALNAKEGPAYSQSAICRFEKLDVTAKSAKRMKPVLEQWLSETEAIHGSNGKYYDVQLMSQTPRKRKRRTCFSPQALSQLVDQLRKNPYPSSRSSSKMVAICIRFPLLNLAFLISFNQSIRFMFSSNSSSVLTRIGLLGTIKYRCCVPFVLCNNCPNRIH